MTAINWFIDGLNWQGLIFGFVFMLWGLFWGSR